MNRTRSGEITTNLILAVFRVNGLLLAAGDRLTRELRLTSARWQVMGTLDGNALTATQIAREMGLKRQSVQRLVDVLAEEGIVAFEPNPLHRRAKLIRLTELGKHKYEQISQIQARWVNDLSRGLDPARLESTIELLRDIEQRLQQET
ncbi:MAG: MarR family transcriptional regulator [Proteobacteria bacterium]|nr:MAG: MarR family transcriptional regulator [Pseudomonadota bacterium]QKK11831.1 MAG: MarR family transcriptional regulator [Pseudomonadota bacterium]